MSRSFGKYIKGIERYQEKKAKNSKLLIDGEYDGITVEKNLELYDAFVAKSFAKPFLSMKGNQTETLVNGKHMFEKLNVDEQVGVLMNIVNLFKSGRTGSVDLSLIGGSKNAAVMCISSNLSNWKNTYSDVRIVDYSASGIHKKVSDNLLELL